MQDRTPTRRFVLWSLLHVKRGTGTTLAWYYDKKYKVYETKDESYPTALTTLLSCEWHAVRLETCFSMYPFREAISFLHL
jgi:hypothetical protein